MKYSIYSMKDRCNGFMNVLMDVNDETAIRGFLHSLKSQPSTSLFYAHPEDYSLYRIGTFDTTSGEVVLDATPTWLCTGEIRTGVENVEALSD